MSPNSISSKLTEPIEKKKYLIIFFSCKSLSKFCSCVVNKATKPKTKTNNSPLL